MRTNINKIVRDVKMIAKDVDVKLKNETKACGRGCSHCCHQLIPVHAMEEFHITRYVDENLNQETKSLIGINLKNWLEKFNEAMGEGIVPFDKFNVVVKTIAENKMTCPFLLNGECSIYPARPIACRTHYVTDNPSECETNVLRNGEAKGIKVHKDAFDRISREADFEQARLLTYAVAEHFKVNHLIKVGIESGMILSMMQRRGESAIS